MAEDDPIDPLPRLRELLEAGERAPLDAYLHAALWPDIGRTMTLLEADERHRLLELVEPETAADLLRSLADAQGADLLEELPANVAAAIANELEDHHRADLLGELDETDAEAILHRMDPEEAAGTRALLQYEEDTAGGLMSREFVSYPQEMTVAEVIDHIRHHTEQYTDFGVHYAYVESDTGSLIGVLRLRDLLLASPEKRLREIMIVNPVYVLTDTSLDEVDELFDRYSFWGVPVVEEDGRMAGVVRRSDAEEALSEERERSFLKFSGIMGGEELRTMPLRERTQRRLAWLTLNMGLSVCAASVIPLFEDTVSRLFALVFFMPVICNMSGCSGNQAVAVSIRELALGVIQPRDYLRVWVKEVGVGITNGIVLGAGLGIVAQLMWHDRPTLGFIIGMAFALNTLVAVSLGGLIPMLLRALEFDAALGAPPMLTTMTDMCGFLILLSLATAAMQLGYL